MFSSRSNNNDSSKTESKPLAKKSHGIPSVLSSDLAILGNIISDGAVDIDGYVEGNVQCTNASIHKNGRVKGDVVAENIQIYGKVEGLIKARSVQLFKGCHVEGVIMHESITIEDGAFVDGRFKRTDRVLEDTSSKEEIYASTFPQHATPAVPTEDRLDASNKGDALSSDAPEPADDTETVGKSDDEDIPPALDDTTIAEMMGSKPEAESPFTRLMAQSDDTPPVPDPRGASLRFEMLADDEDDNDDDEDEAKRPRRMRMLDNLRLISDGNN